MTNRSDEMCENCIKWQGDSRGEQGDCMLDEDVPVLTGRFESCVRFLQRHLVDMGDMHWE